MNIRFLVPSTSTMTNGNIITSQRWSSLLSTLGHHVITGRDTYDEPCDIVVAFNAYKTYHQVMDIRRRRGDIPVIICLTGTDIYQDLPREPLKKEVLNLADQLVVLQPTIIDLLPSPVRSKTMVIYQSAVRPSIEPDKSTSHFDVCVIGHLREVKDPLRTAKAARLLPLRSRIRVLHIGKALSDDFGRAAALEVEQNPRYHWLGEKSKEETERILLNSHLLALTSLSEGGANVISEAVVSGVPVIASDIPCVQGLLGNDYPGLFPPGDTHKLANLLLQAESDKEYYAELLYRCNKQAYKFDPALEREQLRILIEKVGGSGFGKENPDTLIS
ncbi:MAG: selenoneine biosynthesis selenosugar synthase SenB [Dehalococcoidia bacterium]|nr:selenoneine biosynthesis selenosugar synthase SenB [Dehalococcoidia bacterium]